jgi:hypothetical protein
VSWLQRFCTIFFTRAHASSRLFVSDTSEACSKLSSSFVASAAQLMAYVCVLSVCRGVRRPPIDTESASRRALASS